MLVHLPSLLDTACLENLRQFVDALEFEDGRATAGWHAREVKHNQQARRSIALNQVQAIVVAALERNAVFQSFALPLRIAPPLVSRTRPGEGYGRHVDDAIMDKDRPMRTDLSVTVFLSDPSSYEGGELVLETPSGEDGAKFPMGDAVVYPSTTLHRVERVASGERLVAATWVQSRVRDAPAREMLFDLDRARRLIFARDGKSEAFDLVSKSHANLLRRWAEL